MDLNDAIEYIGRRKGLSTIGELMDEAKDHFLETLSAKDAELEIDELQYHWMHVQEESGLTKDSSIDELDEFLDEEDE